MRTVVRGNDLPFMKNYVPLSKSTTALNIPNYKFHFIILFSYHQLSDLYPHRPININKYTVN